MPLPSKMPFATENGRERKSPGSTQTIRLDSTTNMTKQKARMSLPRAGKEVCDMAKFIARVFVPMYVELEAKDEDEAKQKAQEWYKEQKADWRESTAEVVPLP